MIPGVPPDIQRILEAGNSAPSGENCQPWRFIISANNIEVHLLPERDRSAYGWGQRASYLAVGAAIENIVIAASDEQYRSEVTYFPDSADMWHVATIALVNDPSLCPDTLTPFIHQRISNRKPYRKESLTTEERVALESAVGEKEHITFSLIEDREAIKRLARIGSTNEEVMLANRALHNFFFDHVNWTKEEDNEKKVGFYIKTLELPPPAEAMFKVFRHWSIMWVLGALGFNRIVAQQNGATNAAAAAIGACTVSGTEPLDFVRVGRAVERFWLTGTAHGLSLQPLVGILFFKLKIDGGEEAAFSSREQRLIMNAYQEASRLTGAGKKHIAFMFRIGHADPPSARAVRFPLEEVVTSST